MVLDVQSVVKAVVSLHPDYGDVVVLEEFD